MHSYENSYLVSSKKTYDNKNFHSNSQNSFDGQDVMQGEGKTISQDDEPVTARFYGHQNKSPSGVSFHHSNDNLK